MPSKHANIAEQLQRIVNKLIFFEKKGVFHLGETKLYPSEIHLMLVIADGQATNATEMAKRLGVTKGAVSQTMSRLEKKGILHKSKDPFNKNELTASFTPSGKAAIEQFREVRASFHTAYIEYLATLSDEECNVISGFLSHVEGFVNKMQ